MAPQRKQISRISKLFIDRDQKSNDVVMEERRKHRLTVRCGPDVRGSRTLQLAAITATTIANRCFPGAVKVQLERETSGAPASLWPERKQTLGSLFAECVGANAIVGNTPVPGERVIVFGDAPATDAALRATFDGWTATVGPANQLNRLPEREFCSLAGVLAGALSISEEFLSFAEISIAATHRTIGLSLWRPDLPILDPAALGIRVEVLPAELWMLGLGHLGNAYLWSLATLPFTQSALVFLNDFDLVEGENFETGLLFGLHDVGMRKTRVCSRWLEARGFGTALVERMFDANFRCRIDEPRLAFCGFDTNAARRHLASADFLRAIESGLGATADNFDTITLHTLPNARSADELWPDLPPDQVEKRERLRARHALENPGYQELAEDECGRYELAGESVAIPFVGVAAGTLVLAESLRLLHGGPAYEAIKLSLSSLDYRYAPMVRSYMAQDTIGLRFLSV